GAPWLQIPCRSSQAMSADGRSDGSRCDAEVPGSLRRGGPGIPQKPALEDARDPTFCDLLIVVSAKPPRPGANSRNPHFKGTEPWPASDPCKTASWSDASKPRRGPPAASSFPIP